MGCGSACTEKETSPKVGKFAELEMWANTQRDGRPVKYRWRPSVQRRKVWLTPNTWLPCSNAAKTRNPLKLAGMPKLPDRSQPLVGRSSRYCRDMWRRYCCLTSFFFWLLIHALVAKIWPNKVMRWCPDGDFYVLYFQRAMCRTFQTCILNSHEGHIMCGSMIDI